MYSIAAFPHLRKLFATLFIVLAMHSTALPFGMHLGVESVHAADVCDGTCG